MNKLNRTEVLYTAMFGALWGVIEVALGTFLHMAKVPMRGFALAFIAATILVCAKEFVRYRGSLVFIGLIAASFKAISMGGFTLTPMIAIFLESLAGEAVFFLLGVNLFSSISAGSVILLYTFLHGLLSQLIFFGMNIFTIYNDVLLRLFGRQQNKNYIIIVIAILALVHILSGALAGILGRRIALQTKIQISREGV